MIARLLDGRGEKLSEPFLADGVVIAFDTDVLLRLTRLNADERDALLLACTPLASYGA